jgi:hypothetical protein
MFRLLCNLAICVLLCGRSEPGTSLVKPGPKAYAVDVVVGWLLGQVSGVWWIYLPLVGLVGLGIYDLSRKSCHPWTFGFDARLLSFTTLGVILAELY